MLSWVVWLVEVFGYVWSLGAIALAGFLWFGAFSLPGWIRASAQQIAVALLVFAACTYVMRTTYSDGIKAERAKWESAKAAEDKRRDAELARAHADHMAALQRIGEQDRDIEAKRNEIERLSHTHDGAVSLPADSVLRLNAVH